MRPLVALVLLSSPLLAADPPKPDKDGFVPLFNGKDLSGWVNVNCAKGTFFVKGDEVITTGQPTGFLRTDRQYENFVLEMDWMHANTKEVGNSGLFVWGDPLPAVGTGYTRGIEVQVLVNLTYKDKAGNVTASSHGDLFSIWGAKCKPDRPHPSGAERCLPSENHCKGGGEWNHYKVTAKNGVIKLEVNGHEVSGVSECNPRKGYLALESEGAECHFKNLRIKELPTSNPKPEQCAKLDEGHKSLFDGLTFDGWKAEKGDWKASDGVFRCTGKIDLTTAKEYGPFAELVLDWRTAGKKAGELNVTYAGMPFKIVVSDDSQPGTWHRQTFEIERVTKPGPISVKAADGLELRNLFLREMKGEKK
jgi:hypothetical protein